MRRSTAALTLTVAFAAPLAAEEPPPPKVTISRETTFVLGPLGPDGMVDFVAALDAMNAPDITPENDAGVFWRPEFVHDIPGEIERYGLDPATLPADRFQGGRGAEQDLARLLSALKVPEPEGGFKAAFEREWAFAFVRPWKQAEAPVISAWLEANANALARVAQGARRTRYRFQLNPKVHSVVAQGLPSLLKVRNAANAFRLRALNHLAEGRRDAAMDDLLSALRLRMIGEGPTLIERLIGVAVSGLAVEAMPLLYAERPLETAQVERLHAELRRLPRLPDPIDAIDMSERLGLLDAVSAEARRATAAMGAESGLDSMMGLPRDVFETTLVGAVDFDEYLRAVNGLCDLALASVRAPAAERPAAMARYLAALQSKEGQEMFERPEFLQTVPGQAKDPAFRRRLGRALGVRVAQVALPSTLRASVSRDEELAQEYVLRLVVASLRQQGRAGGAWPATLADVDVPAEDRSAVRHGYAYRLHRGAGALAVTAVPERVNETGVRGFCFDTAGQRAQSTDGAEPKVDAGRCVAADPRPQG